MAPVMPWQKTPYLLQCTIVRVLTPFGCQLHRHPVATQHAHHLKVPRVFPSHLIKEVGSTGCLGSMGSCRYGQFYEGANSEAIPMCAILPCRFLCVEGGGGGLLVTAELGKRGGNASILCPTEHDTYVYTACARSMVGHAHVARYLCSIFMTQKYTYTPMIIIEHQIAHTLVIRTNIVHHSGDPVVGDEHGCCTGCCGALTSCLPTAGCTNIHVVYK